MRRFISEFLKNEAGATSIEYALIAAGLSIVIVLTVAVINLAVGPRTFRPSIYGKIATATFVLTGVVTLYFNYLERSSGLVTAFIYASLVITIVSAFHYGMQVVRMGH